MKPAFHGIDEYAARLIRFKALQLCRTPGFSASDRADVEQELRGHLVARLSRFDPERASLHTFISRLVERKIIEILRYHLAAMRSPHRNEASLNDEVLDGDDRVVERHQTTPEATGDARRLRELELDMAAVLAALPDDLRAIAIGLAIGTPNSTCEDLDVARRAMPKAIEEIREFFRDAGLDQYL